MKINYKFNKSSEALTCKVESVELEIIEKAVDRKLLIEELKELLRTDGDIDEDSLEELNQLENEISIVSFLIDSDWDYNDSFEVVEYDLYKSFETGTSSFSLGDHSYISFEITTGDFGYEVHSAEAFTEDQKEKVTVKIFTSSIELKEYINSIEGKIKFVAKTSIDEVLLKDWLGSWETDTKIPNSFTMIQLTSTIKAVHHSTTSVVELFKETRDNPYGELEKHSFWLNYKEFDDLFNNKVKTGSPKLNTNWKFKIK